MTDNNSVSTYVQTLLLACLLLLLPLTAMARITVRDGLGRNVTLQ